VDIADQNTGNPELGPRVRVLTSAYLVGDMLPCFGGCFRVHAHAHILLFTKEPHTMTMKRLPILAIALSLVAGACGGPGAPSDVKPTFTADLKTSNENPPISNAETGGSGTANITFDVTRDASNNITAATATFVVTLTGFPANTPINIAHIHQAPAGTNGSVVVSTSLAAGEVTLANGSGSFTKTGIVINPVDLANRIIANPSGFYFNAHSTLNPGGVVRGQLVKVQ
jgi:hypothetical protein